MIFHAIPSIFPVYSHWNALFRQGISTDFPRLARLCSCSGENDWERCVLLQQLGAASLRCQPTGQEGRQGRPGFSRPVVQHGELNIKKKTIQNSSKHGDFTFVKNDFNDFFQKDGGYEQSDVYWWYLYNRIPTDITQQCGFVQKLGTPKNIRPHWGTNRTMQATFPTKNRAKKDFVHIFPHTQRIHPSIFLKPHLMCGPQGP